MASKSRSRPPRKERKGDNSLAQLGLLNIPSLDLDDNDDDVEVDEGELESELEALLSGKAISRPTRQKKTPAPSVDIEKLAADCMRDSIDEDDDDDANLSGDEDLLAELKTLAPEPSPPELEPEIVPPSAGEDVASTSSSIVTLLEERLKLYKEAVEASKVCNDNSKVRRYGRAVKTLEGLLKSAKSGNNVSEEDIPPVVSIPKPKAAVDASENLPRPNSEVPITISPTRGQNEQSDMDVNGQCASNNHTSSLQSEESSTHAQLIARRNQYKMAALKAKKSGDTETAIKYVRIAKKFDAVIEAESSGQQVDLSNMPPPPPEFAGSIEKVPMATDSHQRTQEETQKSSAIEAAALAAASEPEDPGMFSAPPPPSTVQEALQQRLEKYVSTRDTAQAENNSGKVRRLQRIIKQYETAIKDYKAGKSVDFDELPTPPGFAPIPTEANQSGPSSGSQGMKPASQVPKQIKAPTPPRPEKVSPSNATGDKPTVPERTKSKLRRADTSTVLEKQLEFLLERQKLFRQAALASKKNDDIQQAKEYLRMSKGFDSMIEATRCGLPIDATTIPTPPQLESDFVVIDASECVSEVQGNQQELFETLEKDLQHQIEVCSRNKDHFLRLGDVSSASKFEKLGLESRKDLSVIQYLRKNDESLPRFHYETRLFSMVQCHTDLGDNDLEVTVERGINLPGKPDELDSYIRIEFPIPPETPQRAKTHTIRDTNNPIFQEEFKFEMNRKSRSQLRQFKRQAMKLEVWSKGGFLRSDTLLGIVSIKLVDLESKCSIHDSFDLMDGRKTCGGKLEVKIRIRDPLLVKQVEEVKEKWLVIGS